MSLKDILIRHYKDDPRTQQRIRNSKVSLNLDQEQDTISFTLTEKKRKKPAKYEEPILDFLGINLEEQGPSASRDTLTELTMGMHQYEFKYFPKPIGNPPKDPKEDWGLGNY